MNGWNGDGRIPGLKGNPHCRTILQSFVVSAAQASKLAVPAAALRVRIGEFIGPLIYYYRRYEYDIIVPRSIEEGMVVFRNKREFVVLKSVVSNCAKRFFKQQLTIDRYERMRQVCVGTDPGFCRGRARKNCAHDSRRQ